MEVSWKIFLLRFRIVTSGACLMKNVRFGNLESGCLVLVKASWKRLLFRSRDLVFFTVHHVFAIHLRRSACNRENSTKLNTPTTPRHRSPHHHTPKPSTTSHLPQHHTPQRYPHTTTHHSPQSCKHTATPHHTKRHTTLHTR